MSSLVIVAHPDDETIGCGGTIAKLVEAGEPVDVLVSTRIGPFLDRYRGVEGNVDRIRQLEAERACEVLGVRELYFGDFEEVHLSARPFPVLVDFIRDMILKTRPSLILTHQGTDLHQDHRAVYEAVCIASRRFTYPSDFPLSSVQVFSVDSVPSFPFGVYVSLTESQIEKKLKALSCYELEIRIPPHPRSLEALKSKAQFFGQQIGVSYAELFNLIWKLS